MNKLFNKAVLNGTTVMGDGLTYPRIPNVYTGDNKGGYQRGDMMDANAVVEMIKELTDTGKITIEELQNLINEEIQERVEGDQDQQRYTDQKIKDLIGTSPETLDTLKEIADALGEDPDFAANVWNKIAELTTKHNEDVQELQDAITSGFENIDFTPYVKKTDVVTDTTNGLMLASDKVKLDAFEEAEQYTKAINLPDSVISNADMSSDANGITLKYIKDNLIDGGSSEVNLQIPVAKPYVNDGILSSDYAGRIASLPYNIIHSININQRDEKYVEINWQYNTLAGSSSGYGQRISPATTSIAGVMSAADKKKLDNIIKQITLNGVSTTIIDGVVDIPLATYDKSEEGRKVGGLLSNRDKSVLDDIAYIGSGIRFFRNTIYNDSSIDLVYQKANWGSNNYPVTQDSNLNINSATTSKAGVMSASDKVKLDSLVKYKAGNGIDITGDTISCTLDTSLYSIVTELPETGLPNKIYLLPSTKTEEGNIYTEYGYVDNKWEEIGKYKANVDLSPYSKALKLPNRVAGFDGAGSFMYINRTPNNVGIVFKLHDLITNVTTNQLVPIFEASQHEAGVMSASDKVKLDGIEAGAQVNKIESVSVNGTPLEITNKDVNIPNATTEKDGMMSKSDKTKLDSLNNYILPAATDTTIGGIKTPARDVVNGTMRIDNVLRINSAGDLELNVDFKYDKLTKKLVLELINGIGHVKTKEIDCTDFIKDGMLESATVEINPEGYDAGTYIKLVFNTDAGKDPVYINVSDLIHEYTAGDGINIADGVISTTPISIKTEKFSFVNAGSHQPTYNYSGVTIYDNRYISGTKYGIAFDEADIGYRGVITSPDGVRTVCFALNNSVRGKIDSIDGKEDRLNFKSTSYLTYSRSGSYTNIDIKDDIKTLIDSISGKQNALTEVQLNNINNAITSISVNDVEQINTNGAVDLTIPNASITENGLMSKEDKAKLDSQPTIKASNATGVTNDDYVVIKKSELNSILSRLSALENKA